MTKWDDFLAAMQKREDEKHKNAVLWILAIIGAVAAVAGIAYAVYRYFSPDYLEDFDEDFDDDFNDFFEDDDFPEMDEASGEKAEKEATRKRRQKRRRGESDPLSVCFADWDGCCTVPAEAFIRGSIFRQV